MADKTDDRKPVDKKEGMIILSRDSEITHEDAQAMVDAFKALYAKHQAAKAAKEAEANKAAAQDASASADSSGSAAKEQG